METPGEAGLPLPELAGGGGKRRAPSVRIGPDLGVAKGSGPPPKWALNPHCS